MEEGLLRVLRRIDEFGGNGRGDRSRLPAEGDLGRVVPVPAAVDAKEKLIVGVNAYKMENEEPYDILYIDESVTDEQLQILHDVKAKRDVAAVERTLAALKNAAESETENTMPYFIDCVKAYATVGEISDALREVFGTYEEPALF
jgi:methylmalonyl-CoA mutase, N-terminal domain